MRVCLLALREISLEEYNCDDGWRCGLWPDVKWRWRWLDTEGTRMRGVFDVFEMWRHTKGCGIISPEISPFLPFCFASFVDSTECRRLLSSRLARNIEVPHKKSFSLKGSSVVQDIAVILLASSSILRYWARVQYFLLCIQSSSFRDLE